MSQTMNISAASIEALAKQYRAVAMNIANASTPGYKRRTGRFEQELAKAGKSARSKANTGFTTVNNRIYCDFTQGSITRTGRKLDVAIQGKALFVVETSSGPLYTRNGIFRRDPDGKLIDSLGRTISGTGGPITIPGDADTSSITIGTDGTIASGENVLGKLKTVVFDNTDDLQPVGDGCFKPAEGVVPSDATSEDFRIHQHFREEANVNSATELINLMRITRLYETNINSMRKVDDQTKSLIDIAMS